MRSNPRVPDVRFPYLSVIIPVFRGESVIRRTIDAVEAHAKTHGWDIEIVVAVSRSGDRTEDVVAVAASDYANVRVLDTTAQFGKGGAVKMGMAVAQGDICCFIDADNAVSFDQVDRLLPHLNDSDVVIGSRYVAGGDPGKRSLVRTILSRGGNLLMRVVLDLHYADTRAPLKIFRREVAKRLFGRARLCGFGFDSEVLFLADRYGYTVREVAVTYEPLEESTVRVPSAAVRSILELLEVRWNWLRGRYDM